MLLPGKVLGRQNQIRLGAFTELLGKQVKDESVRQEWDQVPKDDDTGTWHGSFLQAEGQEFNDSWCWSMGLTTLLSRISDALMPFVFPAAPQPKGVFLVSVGTAA